jgi:hypothetical protein
MWRGGSGGMEAWKKVGGGLPACGGVETGMKAGGGGNNKGKKMGSHLVEGGFGWSTNLRGLVDLGSLLECVFLASTAKNMIGSLLKIL